MKKEKSYETLGEETFKWIENRGTFKKPGQPGRPQLTSTERQRFYHIRKVADKEIDDLAKLLEKLPEDQLRQIFNEKSLGKLFGALFSLKEEHGVHADASGISCTPDALKRRQRIINVSFGIFSEICGTLNRNAEALAPDTYHILQMGGSDETLPEILGLKAVYLKGFRQHQQ